MTDEQFLYSQSAAANSLKRLTFKDIRNFIEISVLDVSILPKTCKEMYFFLLKIYIYMELRVS